MSKFRDLVEKCIGEAAVCWSELPKGNFNLPKAQELADRIVDEYEKIGRAERLESLIAGHMEAMRPLLDEWSKAKEET